MSSSAPDPPATPRVLVIGGGFAGLEVVKKLSRSPARVTLIDKKNHHLFQPLLYEVATAALSPSEIAVPLRYILRKQENVEVLLGEVLEIDLQHRRVRLARQSLEYDFLVVATGATFSYFGHDEWRSHAPGLKTLADALNIRERFLLAFELAERAADPADRERLMTTVIVGGGPTGLELAGTMAEISREVMTAEFDHIDPAHLRVVLVEAAPRVLLPFSESLAAQAQRDLEALGVEVVLEDAVVAIDGDGLELESGRRIETRNLVWAAGVVGDPPAGFDEHLGRQNRVTVESDLSLADHPEVFVVGDLARINDPDTGDEVPGLAPAAMQMGAYVARQIDRRLRGRPASTDPFRYRDKGTMATYARGRAVAAIGKLEFSGYPAWLAWVFVHILFLIGFRNRLMVLLEWAYSYLTFRRGARLITSDFDPTEPFEDDGSG